MTPFVLVAVFALGLLLALFGAGFLGFLCIAGSVGGGAYLALKHPERLRIGR
jgi:hypothetical protein